ncbi:MAG: NAD(P)/FAD-dependent oxidoreductase [Amphiplicatus sp.]
MQGKAVIVGAGIAGLAAAAALAPRFEKVVLFEKDRVPPTPLVRKGAPQGAHVHVLLAGGEAALDALLPGIRADFVAGGAIVARAGLDNRVFDYGAWRPRRDLGATILCMTRPGFEQAIRRRVAALANVDIVEAATVRRITFEDGAAAGVEANGKIQRADLVIDARGRGGPLLEELVEAGFSAPPVDEIGIDMAYATARFRKPEAWRGSAESLLCVPTPPDNHYALLSPIENEEWILSLCGRGDVVPPVDLEGFLAYAARLAAPEIRARLDGAELAGPIRQYRKRAATWRRFEKTGAFPRRFLPIGDVIASFNPVYGQGMSVAAREALALADTLNECSLDNPQLSVLYFDHCLPAISDAWTVAATVDLAYPEVRGERPADFALQQRFRFGLRWLADEDENIHRLMNDIVQMTRPASALRDLSVLARAMAAAKARGAV